MKRSEMIKLLNSFINSNIKPSEESPGWEINSNIAENILNYIEQLGMNPPTIIQSPLTYNRQEGTYGFEVNEWEDE